MSILHSALVACGLSSLSVVSGRAETFLPNLPGGRLRAAADVEDAFSFDVPGADRIREKKNLTSPKKLKFPMTPGGGVILKAAPLRQ